MATLAQYKALPNFINGTYSLEQLQMAIALSDIWQLNELGSGGNGGSLVEFQRAYIANSVSGNVQIIAGTAGQQIKIYLLSLELFGTTENTILIKDGTTTINKHILVARGDFKGFGLDVPAYTLTTGNGLSLDFSSTSEVAVYALYQKI